MKRRRTSPNRLGLVLLLAAVVAGGVALWTWRRHLPHGGGAAKPVEPTEPVAARDAAQQLHGNIEVTKGARDADLGVSARAVALLRTVEMYEWQEHCDAGKCSYSAGWTAQHIDSTKFRVSAGHANAAPPFASARFLAGEIRIGDVVIDPLLVVASRAPVAYPVAANALPPNLAATFSIVDGVLYAGGDPASLRPGAIRVSYRVVPAGEVTVDGVRHGNRLESH